MKTLNFDIDDCVVTACNSLGREMSSSERTDLESNFSVNDKSHKNNLSFYKKIEMICLLVLVKLFI
jgi:hypothetical protein